MNKINFLSLTGKWIVAIGIILLIPTTGLSISIIALGLFFLITNHLVGDNKIKLKNKFALGYALLIAFIILIANRRTTLICVNTGSKAYIVTGYESSPKMKNWYSWNNTIELNEENTFYTSSKSSQVDKMKFRLKMKSGETLSPYGIGGYNGTCGNEYTIQYILYSSFSKLKPESIDDQRFDRLKSEQLIKCTKK